VHWFILIFEKLSIFRVDLEQDKRWVDQNVRSLKVPQNFVRTVVPYSPTRNPRQCESYSTFSFFFHFMDSTNIYGFLALQLVVALPHPHSDMISYNFSHFLIHSKRTRAHVDTQLPRILRRSILMPQWTKTQKKLTSMNPKVFFQVDFPLLN
jgi:hypothetical protein